MNNMTRQLLMGAAIAGMVGAAVTTAHANEEKGVKCVGTNACKGKGGCKSDSNKCKGKNSCHGHTFEAPSEEACTKAGGKVAK